MKRSISSKKGVEDESGFPIGEGEKEIGFWNLGTRSVRGDQLVANEMVRVYTIGDGLRMDFFELWKIICGVDLV